VTLLGLIFIPWTLLVILRGAHNWVPWLLAAAMPFMTASAVIAGGSKVSPFYVAAFAPLVLLVSKPGQRRSRGLTQLVTLMVVYCIATALILPNLFAGTEVLVPRGGIDMQVLDPGELTFTVSNIAQSGYLVLSAAVLLYFSQHPPQRKHFLAFGFAVGTTLNMWALANQLTGVFFPKDIFDATVEGGERFSSYFGEDQRLRGVFSEPSYLAAFSVAGLVYAAAMVPKVSGRARTGFVALAGANVLALYYSFSGTAVAALAVTVALLVLIGGNTLIRGSRQIPVGAAVATLLAAALGVLLSPRLWDYGQNIIGQKVGTTSYSNRSGANSLSWDMVFQTGGFGVGLGSNRPSSFALMLLSNVGVIGTLLFVAVVVVVVRRALRVGGYEPELLALLAVLVAKVLAEPNLGNPTMWCALGACAAAFAVTEEPDGERRSGGLDRQSRTPVVC
jgi:hypothetical protein